MTTRINFASDNYSGIHPAVLNALSKANTGPAKAYGADPHTQKFEEWSRQTFGENTRAYPVFNGTGANVLAIAGSLPRWGSVISAATAHIHTDEAAAPEKNAGAKIYPIEVPDGKLTVKILEEKYPRGHEVHFAKPCIISISQPSELGTLYTPAEIRALADFAHARNVLLHVDGARLPLAATALNTSLANITSKAGVDLLSLGGTKLGLMGAEAVLVFRDGLAPDLDKLRKVHLQLASKMRFLSTQLLALYQDGLWQQTATHILEMARLLGNKIEKLAQEDPRYGIAQTIDTGTVFAKLPEEAVQRAHQKCDFYDWASSPGVYRLMCSYDTTAEDIETLVNLLTPPGQPR